MNDDRFIELLLKDLAGEMLREEREELRHFLKDEECLKRYKLYRMYWSEYDPAYTDNETLFHNVQMRIGEQENSLPDVKADQPGRSSFIYMWKYAAAIILIGVCSFLLYRTIGSDNLTSAGAWKEKTTARGRKVSFVLPDGTHVSLNSDSKIRFPESFSGKSREVYLSGEAFFDVKKDASHPFIIHAGKMNVRVLGTAFNVKAYPNESSSETTLIRGAVEVTLKDRPEDKIILKPTEKLIVDYSTSKAPIEKIEEEEPQRRTAPSNALTQITYMQKQDTTIVETSWVQNKLIFKNEDFAEVGRSMERWYNIDIHFRNEGLKELRFSGNFQTETIDEALMALQVTEPFRYKIEGRSVYIY